METRKYHICNIVSDEKFIDGAIEGLDLYSDKWEMQWVVCRDINTSLQFIKKHTDRIKKIDENNILYYIRENKFDAVFLHSFSVVSPSIIIRIPPHIKLFWFGWGYDIYNFPFYKPFLKWNLYKPLTAKYINSLFDMRFNLFKMRVKYQVLKRYGKLYKKALNRIDYFAGVTDFEYNLLKCNPKFRAKRVSFSYSSPSDLISLENDEEYNGKNILVGNSAAFTNNHLDIIEYLKKVDLAGRKIILPLSYAGPENYVNEVEKSFKDAFGDKVVTLINFMPLDEYKSLIQSCNTAVFFMTRQQAMGNITTALRNGCKVFLSKENPVYQLYMDMGISIFSVENDFNNKMLAEPLSEVEVDRNRSILKSLYGYNSYLEKLKTIYNALEE